MDIKFFSNPPTIANLIELQKEIPNIGRYKLEALAKELIDLLIEIQNEIDHFNEIERNQC